jgi:hypothetical protein
MIAPSLRKHNYGDTLELLIQYDPSGTFRKAWDKYDDLMSDDDRKELLLGALKEEKRLQEFAT